MENGKTLFELSIDTRTLYDLLAKADHNQTVTYTEMTDLLGRHVEGGDPNLQSALRRVENLDGIVFGNVLGVGYKRLSDIEIVQTSEREITAIRRRAKRAGRRVTRIADFDSLPNEVKVRHNAALSLFGALNIMTKPKQVKKLESAVAAAAKELPLGRTLEVFTQ